MKTTPTSDSRRPDLRLFSFAHALLAVLAMAALAVTHRAAAQTTQTLTILGGSGNPGDVAANVEYLNPATNAWQPARLAQFYNGSGFSQPISGHPWGNVSGTNQWINYRTDGHSDAGASGSNPLWYRYRVRFTVPSDATQAQMTFSLKADNRANVLINGVSTGATIVGAADQLNVDAVFSQSVHTGENTITLDIGDEGGLNGFNFRIDLSMQASQPLGIVASGAPTTFDSKPVLNVPANITTTATSAAGAVVTFNPTATSNETVEIFRRHASTAEEWDTYSNTFVSGVTGTFNLSFNVISTNSGDHSVFIDDVKLKSGATTLLADGFETPNVAASSGVFNDSGNLSIPATLGSNWTFTNYGGILQGPSAPNWGTIANGPSPQGSQHAVIRNVNGVQTKMKAVSQVSIVAGQTYTLSFDQASRELPGLDGDLTYTVTLERVISVPVDASPDSGSTFPIGTTTVNLSATTNGGTTTGSFNVTVNTQPVTFTLGNLTQTYDGSAKSITVTSNPANVAYVINYLGDNTNAGSCPVQVLSANPIYSGSKNGTLVINQASSTTVVTINGAPFTYNGSAQTPATVAVTGAGGLNLTPPANYANNTNAGTATASYTYAGDRNHTGSSDSKNFTINKADATIAVNGYTGTYDGAAHGASGTATGVGGANLNGSLSLGATFTNAPGGTANWTFSGGTNYNNAAGSVPIVINKASATITVSGYSGTYDGVAHGASGSATGVGGANLSAGLNLGSTFTNAPGGTANWSFSGGTNYNDDAGTAAIVIAKAKATVNVTGYTGVYDAAAHGAAGTATGVGGANLGAALNLGATFTDVPGGTATWSFVGGTNYEDAGGSVASVITKANAALNVNGYTGVYDAAAHGAIGTAKGVGGVDLGAGLNLGATFTNVPGGTASWTFTGGTNYNDANGTAEIVITKATATVSVNGYTGVYDAVAHGATGTATGVGGVDLSAGLNLGASFTDVPGGTANWSFTGGTNYNDDAGTAAIVITKATATVSVNGYTGVYNGAAHGATGTATGVGGVDLGAGLNLGASFTNFPGGTASWTFTGGTNYQNASGSATIAIAKANPSVVVTPYGVTYDAASHTATVASITGANSETGATVGAVTLNTTHTNAGTYADTWSFAGTNNYNNIASTPITNTIAKANATVTVNGYTGIYDGNAHGATGTASGVGGVNLSASLDLGASFTNAPGGTANWTFTGGTNYNNASGAAAIAIAKADATISVTGYNVIYDGQPHTATGSAKGVKGEALSGLNLSATTRTNAGSTTDTWTFTDVTGNYNNASGTVANVITKAATKTTLAAVPTVQAVGQPVTLTATVTPLTPVSHAADGTVTFTVGSLTLGTATLNSSGVATLTTTAIPLGPQSIVATYSGSGNFVGSASSAASVLIYGYPAGGGTFVIGDGNAAVGASVNFWGSQWEKNNSLSGGASNASFKGFAVSPATPAVGATFTAAPGNSAPSPSAVPAYLGVIVTSKVTKSGSNITGTIVKLVVVKTDPGYAGNPGSAGTGTIVATIP